MGLTSMMTLVAFAVALCSLPRVICQNSSEEYKLDYEGSVVSPYITTEGIVLHIQPDEYIPGNLLFSDLNSLKTTDGEKTSTIVGSALASGYKEGRGVQARLNRISGFVQMDRRKVLVVDRMNHCMRSVDRNYRSTRTFVGNCIQRAYADGENALFYFPNAITRNMKEKELQYLVTDEWNSAIRIIHPKKAIVSTYFKNKGSVTFKPIRLAQDRQSGNLYVTSNRNFAVFELTYTTKTLRLLAGGEKGLQGWHDRSTASTLGSLRDAILIEHGTKLLIADEGRGRVRVFDFIANETSSICYRKGQTSSGTALDKCRLNSPYTFAIKGADIFIGVKKGIVKLSQKLNPPSTTNFVEWTTSKMLNAVLRRVEFKATYDFECRKLIDPVTNQLLRGTAQGRYDQIMLLCGNVCGTQEDDQDVKLTCSGDILTISWPTGLIYPAGISSIPDSLHKRLSEKLRNRRVADLLHIMDFDRNPPLVYPRKTPDGKYAEVVLSSSCTEPNIIYDRQNDSCI